MELLHFLKAYEVFWEKTDTLKYFEKFTGKHLHQSLFYLKVQAGVFTCEICIF